MKTPVEIEIKDENCIIIDGEQWFRHEFVQMKMMQEYLKGIDVVSNSRFYDNHAFNREYEYLNDTQP
jgi:hypothetical protein